MIRPMRIAPKTQYVLRHQSDGTPAGTFYGTREEVYTLAQQCRYSFYAQGYEPAGHATFPPPV